MWKAKAKLGEIFPKEEASTAASAPAALPWEDARVREILGAAADPKHMTRRIT